MARFVCSLVFLFGLIMYGGCVPCKFDFEHGLDGWEKTGTAFDNQPTFGDNPTARNRGQPANQQGNWWIGGAEDRPSESATAGQLQGDDPQGTLTSPLFKITGETISFLIGGGCNIKDVRAELIVGGQVVRQATATGCTETMTRRIWNVGHLNGQQARLRLIDSSSESWGHINFDDLRGDMSCSAIAPCRFDFEHGMNGWVKTGTAFNNQPTFGDNPTARNRGQRASQQGNWWIGGAEDRPSESTTAGQLQGDDPQGTLTSPSFIITGEMISFLIGGGCHLNDARVELVVGDKVEKRATGLCDEMMIPKEWTVGEFYGQAAKIRLVDNSSGSWGHINFDDLHGDISCFIGVDCQDEPTREGECQANANTNYCRNEVTFMAEFCPKSCGICSANNQRG